MSLTAVMLDVRFKWAFPAIMLGNLITELLLMWLSSKGSSAQRVLETNCCFIEGYTRVAGVWLTICASTFDGVVVQFHRQN